MGSSRAPACAVLLDSHIHLWPQTEIDQLHWQKPRGPLYSQHSVNDYLATVGRYADLFVPANDFSRPGLHRGMSSRAQGCPTQRPALRGYIFVETDRTSGLDESEWKCALHEASFMRRVAVGLPKPGDGFGDSDQHFCKGIVLWAPVAAGVDKLQLYRDMALGAAGRAEPLVKGWRYLVQDKPDSIMLSDEFIAGVKQIGKWDEVFELGIDCRQRGLQQLLEAVTCLGKIYDGVPEDERVTIVIDHMCKPNMRLAEPDPGWKDIITELAQFPNTFMKLSGGFSEIEPLPPILKGAEPTRRGGQPRAAGSRRRRTTRRNHTPEHSLDVFVRGDTETGKVGEKIEYSESEDDILARRSRLITLEDDATDEDSDTDEDIESSDSDTDAELDEDGDWVQISKPKRPYFHRSHGRDAIGGRYALDLRREPAYKHARSIIHKHLDVVWEAFGPDRCMFGSDWPVCNVGFGNRDKEEKSAWGEWVDVIEKWVERKDLPNDHRALLFSGVAAKVYKVPEAHWEPAVMAILEEERVENERFRKQYAFSGQRCREAEKYDAMEELERREDVKAMSTRRTSPTRDPYEFEIRLKMIT